MKWIRRILLGLLTLLLLMVLVVAGLIFFDGLFGPDTAEFANVQYTDSRGNELLGYLAEPSGPGPHPGVLMLHEWWGLNEEITQVADALAQEGYVVLVPDAYRGRVTAQVPRALWLRLTTPEEGIFGDIDAGLAHLQSLGSVDAARVASWGFCFGGEQSLQLALRQPGATAATVMYYGSVVTDPNQLRVLRDGGPLLGIFGAEDQQIPVAEVNAFEEALVAAGVPHEITIYPGVGHAFLTAENYNDEFSAPGEAWQQTLAFLEQTIRE